MIGLLLFTHLMAGMTGNPPANQGCGQHEYAVNVVTCEPADGSWWPTRWFADCRYWQGNLEIHAVREGQSA